MSATVINSSIPAGSSVSNTFVNSQPFRAIQLSMSQTMAAPSPLGCTVSYAISIDGGATYSDFSHAGHEPNPMGSPSFGHCSILNNETADHVLFKVTNTGTVVCSNFTLEAECFS
jgi:hypothetical protein